MIRGDLVFFFFNDTATTEIYTLSLHDALPICGEAAGEILHLVPDGAERLAPGAEVSAEIDWPRRHRLMRVRSEEHTSELQSRQYLVCRLLLEKKNKNQKNLEKKTISEKRHSLT